MIRKFTVLMLLFFLLSGCTSVEGGIEVGGETVEPATASEAPTPQIETAATASETQPAPTKPPTPMSPYTEGSIAPGQQKAYSFQASSGEEILFWLYLPDEYDGSQTWPLILSLHGFLGFEPSLERVREQSPPPYVDPDIEFPFIVLSPEAPNGPWAQYHDPMDELIEFLGESISIDTEAQFLVGLSAGVTGAWQWASALPDRFMGIATIAGSPSMNPGNPVLEEICLLKDLPIWVTHSEADELVPIEPLRAAVTALEDCGSTVTHFTAYTDLSHVETFHKAYAGPELYDWMLSLRR